VRRVRRKTRVVGRRMTDLSLEDLAGGGSGGGEAASAAADAAEEAAESGESLLDLFEFMDDRGYLEPLMFGMNGGDDGGEPAPVNTTDDGDGEGALSPRARDSRQHTGVSNRGAYGN